MVKGIFHIGIAVESLEKGLELYRDTLGFEFEGIEELPDRGMRVAMLRGGGTHIELLESTDSDSVIGRFLSKRGAGVHHLALQVDDVDSSLSRLKSSGLRLVDEVGRPGAGGSKVAFLHPRSTQGVLLELCEAGPLCETGSSTSESH